MNSNTTGNAEIVDASHSTTKRQIVTISNPKVVDKLYKVTKLYNEDFPPTASAVVQKLIDLYTVEELFSLIQQKRKAVSYE